jgi:WD40 repeat protein
LHSYVHPATKSPCRVRFSKDLRYVGLGYLDDGLVVILNAFFPFSVNKTFNAGHTAQTIDLDFSKNGELLLTCGKDKKAKTWNISNNWSLKSTSQTFSTLTKTCRF